MCEFLILTKCCMYFEIQWCTITYIFDGHCWHKTTVNKIEETCAKFEREKVCAFVVLTLGSCDATVVGSYRTHKKGGGASETKGRAGMNQWSFRKRSNGMHATLHTTMNFIIIFTTLRFFEIFYMLYTVPYI